MPRYQGVDVEHPRIVEYAKNMLAEGKKLDESTEAFKRRVSQVVGMPVEVIEKIERDMQREKR